MLNLRTTEDFSSWFRALDDADAEEVATAIELLQELLPEREPPGSRELLLWFQSDTGQPWVDQRFDDRFFEFSQRVSQFVQHLGSAPVQRKLSDVEGASAAIAAIMNLARVQRRWSGYTPDAARRALEEVQHRYRSILSSTGIAEPPASAPGPALRELNLRRREPNMRILYGVDAAHGRALLVLGEHLDRSAYGPSVRRALSLWREFLSGATESAREHVR